MDWNHLKKRASEAIAITYEKTAPALKIAATACVTYAQLKERTVVGTVGAVAQGVESLNEWVEDQSDNWVSLVNYTGLSSLITHVLDSSYQRVTPRPRWRKWKAQWNLPQGSVFLDADGDLCCTGDRDTIWAEVCKLFDLYHGKRLKVEWGLSDERLGVKDLDVSGLPSPKAEEVLEQIRPMMDENRVILFTGRPGTGKTRMALWLAEKFSQRRIISLSSSLMDMRSNILFSLLELANPDVVIVDDIDKDPPDLNHIEILKKTVKLTIFTANDGYDDEVIDGASVRCERVDESWEIEDIGIHPTREPPFDQLEESIWERIKEWPAAAQGEVGRRIEKRGVDEKSLRLDEIETRIGMRCKRDLPSPSRYPKAI